MEIDLMKLPYGACESEMEASQLKASKILTTLNYINNNSSVKYTELLVSMNVFNIIESHSYFHSDKIQPTTIDEPFIVGRFNNFICLLDFQLPPDELILRLDTQTLREVKLNSLFNNEAFPVSLSLYLKGN